MTGMEREPPRKTDEVLSWTNNGVGWVSMNRPQAGNAGTPAMMESLCAHLDVMIQDETVRAIVLTGEGRHFLAGGDFGFLQEIARGEVDAEREIYRWFQGAATRLFQSAKPTIAAIARGAITVGCELSLSCDIRIAARSAFFQESWLDVSLIPPLGGALLLPRIVGLGLAKEMILDCRRVGAEEALEKGLICELADDVASLRETAQARAERMASRPAGAFGRAKELLHSGLQSTISEAWETGLKAQALSLRSQEFRNAIAAKDPRGKRDKDS